MNSNIFINGFKNDVSYIDSITPSYEDEKDNTKWVGKVIDNVDPMYLGRCRIRIFGYYDEIPETAIPWATSESSYVGSKHGTLIVPEIGTIIRGYFDNGDTQKPVYTNTFLKQDDLDSSITRFERTDDYPNNMVLFETDLGESLILNKKSGLTTFNHRSGLVLSISSNGSISIEQNTDSTEETKPTLNVSISGKTTITSNDDLTVNSEANVLIKSARGEIRLGNNAAKQLVCNLPNCLVTGAPHAVGNTQVKV